MKFKGCALSVRGASHEEAGECCQDSARIFTSEGFAVAAVSDGHGSEKHFRSAVGSEMATRIAIRSVCDFSERNGGLDRLFRSDPDNTARRIAANMICGWNGEISAHLGLFPLTPHEQAVCDKYGGIPAESMYGATLIAAAVTNQGYFGLQIGDGTLCALSGGEMTTPMPADAALIGNLTTSLCDSDAISSFRYFYISGKTEGLMLSSDGLINSFLCEEDFLKFGRRVINSVESGSDSFLGEHLKNRSRLGSRDDISVAALTVKY